MTEFSHRQQSNEAERGDAESTYTIPAISTDSIPEIPEQPPHTTQETMRVLAKTADQSDNESSSLFTRRRVLAASVLAGTILAGSAFFGGILAAKGGSEKTEPRAEAGTSAPATPGQSISPSETMNKDPFATKAIYPESIFGGEFYSSLTPEQKSTIDKYDQMAPEVFNRLPVEKQMLYGEFYTGVFEEYATELMKRDNTYTTVGFYPPKNEMTENSPGGDILKYIAKERTTVLLSLVEKGNPDKIRDAQRANAAKAMALIYDPQVHFSNTSEKVMNITTFKPVDKSNQYDGNDYSPNVATAESPTLHDGDLIHKYINVMNADASLQQRHYVYRTFTDIEGKKQAAWQLTGAISQSNPQFIPDIEALK